MRIFNHSKVKNVCYSLKIIISLSSVYFFDIIAEHEKCIVFIKNKLLILHNATRQKLPKSNEHYLG